MGEKMRSHNARVGMPDDVLEGDSEGIGLLELSVILKSRWKLLVGAPLLAAALAYGAARGAYDG